MVLLNAAFAAEVQRRSTRTTASLDMDAILVETFKKAALYCYKKFKAYMKEDLAGGKLPSQSFGANAAWRQMMILAFNVNAAIKRLVLGEVWVNRRMKAVRFWLINLPGRIHKRGRQLFVRLAGGHPSNEILFEARRRMLCLCDSG